jgi:hypothetical protein
VAAPWTLAKTTAGRSHKVIASPKASKTPGSAQAPPDSNGKHAFYHLSVKQELSNDTMIFRLHSIEERDEWVTLINLFAARTAENKLAIRNAKAKSAQNPLNPMSRKNRAALHAINKKQQEKRLSQTSLPPPEDLISDDEVVDDISAPGETNSPGEA